MAGTGRWARWQHGFKDRVSYLAITREDIIAGYDGLVEEAVAELLRRKKPTPRAIMIFVSCLDDLIGTDLDSLCLRLHAAHPETEFRPAHMNPITLDSKKPPMVTTQAAMYSFLRRTEVHDQGDQPPGQSGRAGSRLRAVSGAEGLGLRAGSAPVGL